jgi:hypothetical protein
MESVPKKRPTTPADALERGWREYAATVLAYVPDERDDPLARMTYFAGAAHTIGLVLGGDPATWQSTLEALGAEVSADADRLVPAAMRGEVTR